MTFDQYLAEAEKRGLPVKVNMDKVDGVIHSKMVPVPKIREWLNKGVLIQPSPEHLDYLVGMLNQN